MANTITKTYTLLSKVRAVVYLTLVSDSTQETNTVVYDSAAVATLAGDVNPLTCTIESVYGSVSSSAATTPIVRLNFDAATPVLALDIPAKTNPTQADFRRNIPVGGLKNRAGGGISGDITLTTVGLAAGDCMTLVLEVRRN